MSWVIAIVVILLAIALSGNSWNPDTGQTAGPVGNCQDASGLGC